MNPFDRVGSGLDLFGREVSLLRKEGDVRTYEIGISLAVAGLLSLYLLSLAAMFSGGVLPAVIRVPIVVVTVTFVPGGFVVLTLRDDPTLGARQILYAYGVSLLLLMFVGSVTNIVLPSVGVEQPLTLLPLAGAVTVTVGVLGVATVLRSNHEVVRLRVPPLFEPAPLGFVALPLVAILGVMVLNATGSNLLILIALTVIAVVPLIVILRVRREWYAFGVWTMALAILYHKSLWRYSGFSGRPHGIDAWKAGRWSPGVTEISPYSSELLPTGLLFPMYAVLSDVFILTEYDVINPLLVSFIPVAIFVAVRRFVDSDMAFLAATLFAFAHPFYLQYPTAGRAASPVIFLTLFGVTLSDTESRPMSRSFLAVAFLMGVVVAHYGTSYLVTFAFSLALVVLFVVKRTTGVLLAHRNKLPITDGGAYLRMGRPLDPEEQRLSLLSILLVVYFSTATLAWYTYMRGGWKSQLLVNHIQENIQQASNQEFGGRTAARVVKDYEGLSIEIAKYVYIVVGVLMATGLLVVFYRRMVAGEAVVDASYYAVAASMFGIFGLTFIFRNWGGGRPMMITFVFTTVFAVIGIVWLGDITAGSGGREVFAVLLAVLFVLNSGVAASTALGGIAASNVPLQPQLSNSELPQGQHKVHRDTDSAAHVWAVKNGDQQVYADTFGARQYDWFRPSLAASTPAGVEYGPNKPNVWNPRTQSPGTGYVMILGHNQELQTYWPAHPRFEPGVPLEELRLSDRQKIYTNGKSSIYTANTTTAADRD